MRRFLPNTPLFSEWDCRLHRYSHRHRQLQLHLQALLTFSPIYRYFVWRTILCLICVGGTRIWDFTQKTILSVYLNKQAVIHLAENLPNFHWGTPLYGELLSLSPGLGQQASNSQKNNSTTKKPKSHTENFTSDFMAASGCRLEVLACSCSSFFGLVTALPC